MLNFESLQMDKEKLIASGLLHQYALGLTDPEEELVVENYLNTYPELKDEVLRAQRSVRQLALGHGISPRQSRLPDTRQTNPEVRGPVPRKPVNHAIIAAFLGILILWYFQARNTSARYAEQLQAVVENCENGSGKEPIAGIDISHPATKIAVFSSSTLGKANSPVLFWNSQTQSAFFYPADLPPLSSDSCYRLWAEVKGRMVPLAVLKPATPQVIRFIENAQNFHITSNPKHETAPSAVQKPIATAPL